MSKVPISKVTQSWHYIRDKCAHKFWDPESPPDLTVEEDITGQVVIVTGSNTGIGRETALQLAKRKAKVILACRNLEKAAEARDYIWSKFPKATLDIMHLDIGDLSSIRKFVSEFETKYAKLDILVNNAGVMFTDGKLHKTEDGFEVHMGTNHLGPFLLTRLLVPSLKKAGPGKVVCVSSSQLTLCRLDLDDLMMEKRVRTGSDGTEPYNVSKLADALCIRRLASSLKQNDNIHVFQLCPGFVTTDVFRSDVGLFGFVRKIMLRVSGVTPAYGCETVVFCCVNKSLTATEHNMFYGAGEMYRFCARYEEGTSFLDPEDPKAIQLYKMSEEFVGLAE